MTKNGKLVTVVLLVMVVVVGAFLAFKSKGPFDLNLLGREEAELASIASDLDAFSADNLLAKELNQTASDLLDEMPQISAEEALSESSIAKDSRDADLSGSLDDSAKDDATLAGANQAYDELY